MLDTKRSANIVSGGVLAAIGLVTTIAARDIEEGAGGHLHPRSFPLVIGVLLLVGGGALALQALLAKRRNAQAIDWPDRKGWTRWGIALGALVLYVALAPVVGFLVSSFFFVGGLIWYLGRYNPLLAAAYALGLVLFLYGAFVWLLDLTLPSGVLALVVSR